jgi:hypothetical protein
MSCRLYLMDKKGIGALAIIAIVLGSLAITVLGAGVYFYNFHTFKEVRLCLGDPMDTEFECSLMQDCLDKAEELQTEYNVSELPGFARERLEMLAEEAVYCEGTCKVKNIRGINLQTYEIEELESCNVGEKEILIEIKGKEGLQIWNYVKNLE